MITEPLTIIIPVFQRGCVTYGHFVDSPECEIAAAEERGSLAIQLLYKSNENSISQYECEKKKKKKQAWKRLHHSEKVSGRQREVAIAEGRKT